MDCAVMEYTRAKPWPFFMYRSLMAVNCSCRAEENRQEMSSADILHIAEDSNAWNYCIGHAQRNVPVVFT